MLTKLIFIAVSILMILNSTLLITTMHYRKKYNTIRNEYTICTNNLEKVTNDYNNLLNECTISLKKYKENLIRLNKRSNEVKLLINKYKEIKTENLTTDNECEQMKIMLDKFIEIDNEIRLKLGGQQ